MGADGFKPTARKRSEEMMDTALLGVMPQPSLNHMRRVSDEIEEQAAAYARKHRKSLTPAEERLLDIHDPQSLRVAPPVLRLDEYLKTGHTGFTPRDNDEYSG